MSVVYVPFGACHVSRRWATVLRVAVAEHVITSADLTSGHRTMAEQWRLYLHPPAGTPVVAYPNARAPHIKEGDPAHALDVNALNRAVHRLYLFLRGLGARPRFTVTGEPWHIEITTAELIAISDKLRDPLRGFTTAERRMITEYDRLARRKPRGWRHRRDELRARMTTQRKAIWRAAQRGGWQHRNRAARYRALKARTT